MIKIKKLISFLVTIIIVGVIFINRDVIIDRLDDLFKEREVVIYPGNGYQKDGDFIKVKQVTTYVPYSYEDLVNIFYSILNQGWETFTFYCPVEYAECLNDVSLISYDEVLLSEINNYVHPYNSYSTIKTLYDDTGEITVNVKYVYTSEEIVRIDNEINRIISNNISSNMNEVEIIKTLHNYIINNTKYDKTREETDDSIYDSSRMTGLLFEHYAVCSGYTDTMAVMLEKLGIKNFKIASSNHIWNAVFVNGKWLHLDLTWDDPVTLNGKDILDHTYFLIDTEELLRLDKKENEHVFDADFYLEFKN
ncbi:MAG: transglutaminase domain-containing protein [Candidatus Coprovivens sp.]